MRAFERLWGAAALFLLTLALTSCHQGTPGETGDMISPTPGLPVGSPPAQSGETVGGTPSPGSPDASPTATISLPDDIPADPGEWTTNELSVNPLPYDKSYREGGTDLIHVSALFPQTGVPSIDRFYEDCMEDFIRVGEVKAESARQDLQSGHLDMAHYISVNYSVELNSGGLLSVARRTTTFEGGASESTSIACENFSLVSGELLWMDALFTVDKSTYTDRLLQVVYQTIDANPTRFNADAKEQAKELFPYDSFCVTADGLALFYAQYNIAPYTENVVRIDVPWAHFQDIFKVPD